MKGLLYKDLCTLTSRYKKNFLVVFAIVLVIYARNIKTYL